MEGNVIDFNTISVEPTNVVIGLNDAANGIENGMGNLANLENSLKNVVSGLRFAATGIEKAAKELSLLQNFIAAGRDEIMTEVKRRYGNPSIYFKFHTKLDMI